MKNTTAENKMMNDTEVALAALSIATAYNGAKINDEAKEELCGAIVKLSRDFLQSKDESLSKEDVVDIMATLMTTARIAVDFTSERTSFKGVEPITVLSTALMFTVGRRAGDLQGDDKNFVLIGTAIEFIKENTEHKNFLSASHYLASISASVATKVMQHVSTEKAA